MIFPLVEKSYRRRNLQDLSNDNPAFESNNFMIRSLLCERATVTNEDLEDAKKILNGENSFVTLINQDVDVIDAFTTKFHWKAQMHPNAAKCMKGYLDDIRFRQSNLLTDTSNFVDWNHTDSLNYDLKLYNEYVNVSKRRVLVGHGY